MLKEFSKRVYKRIYHRDIYEEPYDTLLLRIEEYLENQETGGAIVDAACGVRGCFVRRLLSDNIVNRADLVGIDIDPSVKEKDDIHNKVIIQDLHQPIPLSDARAVISMK
jgi:hypothetical protein